MALWLHLQALVRSLGTSFLVVCNINSGRSEFPVFLHLQSKQWGQANKIVLPLFFKKKKKKKELVYYYIQKKI